MAMEYILDELTNDLERAEALQTLLISVATNGSSPTGDYQILRKYFVESPAYQDLIPRFVRTNRNTDQFWQFIKYKYGTYAERRQYIWDEFEALMNHLEGKNRTPADDDISEVLRTFNEDGVHSVWSKALERRHTDPDGAITSARTLLETVCKHILDDMQVAYNDKNPEMSELYKAVSKELNLSGDQHSEPVFKQILGGCSSVVNGLGILRNRLGDSHGKNKLAVKPAPRHAELAVNLAGSKALFLISTWQNKKEKG